MAKRKSKKAPRTVGFDTTKTKRGAQPGNESALQHGFYSRTFTEEELVEIGRFAVAELSLDEEIAMLRVLMRRILTSVPALGAGEAIELIGRATGQLRRLMESKRRMEAAGKSEDTVAKAMEHALDELADELGVEL